MRQQQRLLIIDAPQLRAWLLVADRLIGMLVSGLKRWLISPHGVGQCAVDARGRFVCEKHPFGHAMV